MFSQYFSKKDDNSQTAEGSCYIHSSGRTSFTVKQYTNQVHIKK